MINSEIEAYYIGSGSTNAKYTLRCRFWDFDYSGEKVLRDAYVKTLTTKFEESVERSREYIKVLDSNAPLEAEEFVLRTVKPEKRDHSILRFGKYEGMTIDEVKSEDTDYLVWVAQNMTSKANTKTIELIREAVKDELVQAEEVIEKLEEIEKRNEEKRLSSKHVGEVGQRIGQLSLTLTGSYSWDSAYGTQILYFFEDSDHNAFVWKTSSGFCRTVPVEEGSFARSYRPVEKGEIVKVRATIKAHGEYKGQEQTTLTRVKLEE